MLIQLPPEVILNIAGYLTLNDKLSLIKTCHKLNSIISKWILYEELIISTKKPTIKTRDIVRKFKNKALNGTHVKTLKLDLSQLSNQLYRRLPKIFPNLIELIDERRDEGIRNDFILEPFSQWRETLQRYDMEKSGYLEITKLFYKYTFTALTFLNISTRVGIHHIDVQRLLKRVPFLRELRLYWMMINGIAFFEILHEDCQYLNSLTLESTVIDINDISLSATIDPIHSFKALHLEASTVIFDRNLLFFDYIITKYPLLNQLELFFTFERMKLERFIQHNSVIFNETIQELTIRRDNFTKTRELYKETGANRLLSRLPTSITSIGLNTGVFDHVLESLEQNRLLHSLQMLNLVDDKGSPSFIFKNEVHFDCFYRLLSIKTLSVGVSVDIKDYEDNTNVLTNAQRVTLVIKKADATDITMDWLLSTFPNVQEFNIIQSEVQIRTLGAINTRIYPKLNTFNIKRGNIHENLFSFLRILAPNIKHLGCAIQGNAYQHKISWHYFRDRKQAAKDGRLDTFKEAPEQTCFYIDLKGYRLKTFHLFMNLCVNSALGDATVFLDIVLPSSVIQHVYMVNPDSTTSYLGLGKHYKQYEVRQMTKVMVACSTLESFQVDDTRVMDAKAV